MSPMMLAAIRAPSSMTQPREITLSTISASERLPLAADDCHARRPEVVRPADVHPHAIDARAVEGYAFREQFREQVLREIELLIGRDELEDFRLEHVDARVGQVRERFFLPRFLLELLDPALRVE